MGPLRETKEQRVQHHEKEVSRSRIPRLILRPHLPQQQHKVSPASESPFSEEESREFNASSSGRSARTISSNSFCSDDTGCPSSQSVSPVKTPSDTGNSPVGFCPGSDEDFSRKKCTVGMVGEGSIQSSRYKKEPKSGLVKPGSEADFSSSSSTGSISAPEVHMSAAGSKRSSFSRNRGPHGRSNGASSYKSGNSPPSPQEKDFLSMLCRNQLSPVHIHPSYAPSSPSSSNSGSYKGSDGSPVMRRSGRYMSCGENHGVKPPNPEQYLTPLQQKEVTVRHLKTKLKESERRLHERESEILELKSQLARMREDWIEEECHRVEAQLALKEARKEIKQLRQVIETMRSSLADKDKGLQKYFVDINIQNKKLESLLQSMEMAHSGSLRDELCLDFPCDSPEKSFPLKTRFGKMADGLSLEEQVMEEAAERELLDGDSMADGADLFDGMVTATSPEAHDLELLRSTPGAEVHEILPLAEAPGEGGALVEQAVQTDVVPYSPAVSELIQHVLKLQDPCPSSSASPDESGADSTESFAESLSAFMVDLTPRNPNSAILLSPVETPCAAVGMAAPANRLMRELDFAGFTEERLDGVLPLPRGVVGRQYWSSSFLVDLLAVAAPVVPTVLWAFSTQRGGTDPVYNIGALLRGCCVVALHSLRRTAFHMKT
ncbi:syntabulin isoform X3 [Ailuropoda melanoleuca]|uniref:syntabulin isoform X3 n=1 Tax=Ailuropoda melanoleuca TaxID=9646 RepID=UPI001494B839|nr:syntabulin isoform X3 [Ailuropoda melanoleuca]XP_034524387.1 syntabulin isoform X3 [Ailuropoda melanoleuca]XP_034524388.1 syntabulin isoform X3 [Ailuropoda melanoleuca]XP_034524389.1 syntabulin isoform X3 [Ailuropoda melanoleuca]XP_034524390.1 syntabulin isoform X3 [Ailuropoda melanoleuca]XP_034524391.1 syntabulin isoform X3 [Ailuropoda melanoleuca]